MVYLFEQKLNKYLLQYLNNENHVFKKYYAYIVYIYINKEQAYNMRPSTNYNSPKSTYNA